MILWPTSRKLWLRHLLILRRVGTKVLFLLQIKLIAGVTMREEGCNFYLNYRPKRMERRLKQSQLQGHTNPGTMAGGKRDEQTHPSNGHDHPSKGYDSVKKEETEMKNRDEEQMLCPTSPNGNAGGQEEEPACSKHRKAVIGIVVFAVIVIVVLLITILILVALPRSCTMENQKIQEVQTGTPVPLNCSKDAIKCLLTCPNGWYGYEGYCYKLSEEEKNWSESQNACNSQNASLPKITEKEMGTIRMFTKVRGFWIGLRREPNQPGKWLDGENSTMEILGNGGDCVFLDRDFSALSVRCSTKHYYMCKKEMLLRDPERELEV